MSTRIKFKPIVDRIKTVVGPSQARVGSSFDRNFVLTFAKELPEVWVVKSDSSPQSSATALSNRFRQYMYTDVGIRVMMSRFPDGSLEVETAFSKLCDDVASAIIGWSLPESKEPFEWLASTDGDPDQSIVYCDLVFRTLISYQR